MSNLVSSIAGGARELAKLDFTRAEVEELKAKLMALTHAEVTVRGPERGPDGRCIYITVPNVGIQLAATCKALDYAVGKARQTVEVTGPGASGQGQTGLRDLASLMSGNPDIAAKIIATLRDSLKLSQAIDVTATKEEKPAQPPES